MKIDTIEQWWYKMYSSIALQICLKGLLKWLCDPKTRDGPRRDWSLLSVPKVTATTSSGIGYAGAQATSLYLQPKPVTILEDPSRKTCNARSFGQKQLKIPLT